MRKIKHEGFSAYRLNNDNDREKTFAELWQRQNDQGRTIDHIIPKPSARDIQVAATMAQWLGSNAMFYFLNEPVRYFLSVCFWS